MLYFKYYLESWWIVDSGGIRPRNADQGTLYIDLKGDVSGGVFVKPVVPEYAWEATWKVGTSKNVNGLVERMMMDVSDGNEKMMLKTLLTQQMLTQRTQQLMAMVFSGWGLLGAQGEQGGGQGEQGQGGGGRERELWI